MEITREKIHYEVKRRTYWTRIYLKSDDGGKESTVICSASYEYLWVETGKKDFREEDMEKVWIEKIINLYKSQDDSVFDKPVYLEVRATSEEGIENGYKFLEGVTP